MRLLLVVPDGVGVRNFVLGNFLQQARARGAVHVLHGIPRELLKHYDNERTGGVTWGPLRPYRETPRSFTLRYALAYGQMYWADTESMRYSRRQRVHGSWRTRLAHRLAHGIGRLAATPGGLQQLERWHCQAISGLPEVEHYRRLLRRHPPAVLLCTHQRPPAILPAVLAARELGIPTATFIFSWDNLTSKGRIAAPFDYYLVWSEHMRGELLRYYPHVGPERVVVVGTPQFEPYARPCLLWSREQFLRHIGADPARPLICYSGGDSGTCPEDPQHVRVLLELVRGGQICGRPQVLLRPAPVDDGCRYAAVRQAFPELLYAQPAWVHAVPGDWSRVLPLPQDVEFLANLTQHADLNVNLASTMTLDFALHDRPVVNVAFDVASPPPFGIPLWEYYYRFEHYRPVVELGAVRAARSPHELAQHVNTYLGNPALDRSARRQLVELQVALPLGQASQRIVDTLASIAREHHAHLLSV